MDKNRKDLRNILLKDLLKFALTIGVFAGVVMLIMNTLPKDKWEKKEIYDTYISRKLFIDGDTLTIIKYNFLFDTFTLSDNSKITPKLVEDNLIK